MSSSSSEQDHFSKEPAERGVIFPAKCIPHQRNNEVQLQFVIKGLQDEGGNTFDLPMLAVVDGSKDALGLLSWPMSWPACSTEFVLYKGHDPETRERMHRRHLMMLPWNDFTLKTCNVFLQFRIRLCHCPAFEQADDRLLAFGVEVLPRKDTAIRSAPEERFRRLMRFGWLRSPVANLGGVNTEDTKPRPLKPPTGTVPVTLGAKWVGTDNRDSQSVDTHEISYTLTSSTGITSSATTGCQGTLTTGIRGGNDGASAHITATFTVMKSSSSSSSQSKSTSHTHTQKLEIPAGACVFKRYVVRATMHPVTMKVKSEDGEDVHVLHGLMPSSDPVVCLEYETWCGVGAVPESLKELYNKYGTENKMPESRAAEGEDCSVDGLGSAAEQIDLLQ